MIAAFNAALLVLSIGVWTHPRPQADLWSAKSAATYLLRYYHHALSASDGELAPAVEQALQRCSLELALAEAPVQVERCMRSLHEELGPFLLLGRGKNQGEEIGNLLAETVNAVGESIPPFQCLFVRSETGCLLLTWPPECEGLLPADDLAAQAGEILPLAAVVGLTYDGASGSLLSTGEATMLLAAWLEEARKAQTEAAALAGLAGFRPVEGRGVIVRARPMDRTAAGPASISYDVRDIVNELFACGAEGVAVGGERIVATTAIRSADSRLLVNGRPVDYNPLTVVAIGEPKVLTSGLELLRRAPYFRLHLDIEVGEVALPAYERGSEQ